MDNLEESRFEKNVCCRTCRFYEAQRCKRYAPRPSTKSGHKTNYWPLMAADEWCGEYKARTT